MKTYWDLTDKERANLTEDEVRRFCDIELMEQGVIRPVAVPPLVDPLTEPLGTEEWWVVGDVAFKDQDTAYAFLKLLPHKTNCDYCVGSDHKYVEPITDPPQRKQYRNRQEILIRKQELAEYKSKKEAQKLAMEEYNKACKAVENTLEYILEDYYIQRRKMNDMDRLCEIWAEYIQQCDGDKVIARRFLEKAFTPEQIQAAEEWFDCKFVGD